MNISCFFVFFLRWKKSSKKEEKKNTLNSKIVWNNGCENNCHRNMHGRSVHILPVMNSKYMWCIRVALMAQLCHEKIPACTRRTGTLCFEADNRQHHNIISKCGMLSLGCFCILSYRYRFCLFLLFSSVCYFSNPTTQFRFLLYYIQINETKSYTKDE